MLTRELKHLVQPSKENSTTHRVASTKVQVNLATKQQNDLIRSLSLFWWARRDLNPQGLFNQRILSPSRIPIPPLAHLVSKLYFNFDKKWRCVRVTLPSTRFCRPMPNFSANAPYPHYSNKECALNCYFFQSSTTNLLPRTVTTSF